MDEQEMKTCEICGTYNYHTEAQIKGHLPHCRRRNKQETEEDKLEGRSERVPFGTPEQKWSTPSDDGYHYRVFNDNWRKEPGRVQRAMRAGYQIYDNEQSGTNVGTNDDGTEIKGVLMRIPEKFYKEDQAKKARELDKIDEQIHRGKFDNKLTNTYGGVEIETKVNK